MAYELPKRRLARCGATKGEIAFLVREFDRSDLSFQRGLVQFFAEKSEGDVRAHLAGRRRNGDFGAVVEPVVAPRLGRLFRRQAVEAPETALEADFEPDDAHAEQSDPDTNDEAETPAGDLIPDDEGTSTETE